MGGGASKYGETPGADKGGGGSNSTVMGSQLALQGAQPPPPPSEGIRPHGKKIVIKKGCECSWCEAVSWELVGDLRETCEKLQQSLMMREVDRAELEALLQIKIEVSTDLREKLKRATEDIGELSKQIKEQQEKIAMLELRQELHDQPANMTQLEVEELLQWKATVLSALASAGESTPLDDARLIVDRLRNYETATRLADEANERAEKMSAELSSLRLQFENANQEIGRLKKLFAPKKKFNIDTASRPAGLPAFRTVGHDGSGSQAPPMLEDGSPVRFGVTCSLARPPTDRAVPRPARALPGAMPDRPLAFWCLCAFGRPDRRSGTTV